MNTIKLNTIGTPKASGGNSGGGLEGEYFLAKPNGRYWKFTFMNYTENGFIDSYYWANLNEEQQESIKNVYLSVLASFSAVYTCVGNKVNLGGMIPKDGIYWTTYGVIQSNLGYSAGRMEYDSNKSDVFSCLAWQEAYLKIPSSVADILPVGTQLTSIFDYFKLVFEVEIGSLSDEEVYAMMSEMFMIEPISKEEYEDMVSRAEGEDF